LIPVTHDGVIDLDWLTAELADTRPQPGRRDGSNNETGVIQPWRRDSGHLPFNTRCRFFSTPCNGSAKMPAKDWAECDYLSGAAPQVWRAARRGLF